MSKDLIKTMKNKKIRIFKFDHASKIRNFIYSTSSRFKINVLRSEASLPRENYVLLDGRIISKEASFFPPFDYENYLSKYLFSSRHAFVNGQVHIFGGDEDRHRVKTTERFFYI